MKPADLRIAAEQRRTYIHGAAASLVHSESLVHRA